MALHLNSPSRGDRISVVVNRSGAVAVSGYSSDWPPSRVWVALVWLKEEGKLEGYCVLTTEGDLYGTFSAIRRVEAVQSVGERLTKRPRLVAC